ncbi:MAG: S-methyl-5-thioribose-1-phosphate isomerase, partial [Isosphaeraceae bacterium]
MTRPSVEESARETVGWRGDARSGVVRMIDQTRLPTEFLEIECADVPAVGEAIKALRVRGAPAIGIAAADGAVLGGQNALASGGDVPAVVASVRDASAYLRTSRPTAVNLF